MQQLCCEAGMKWRAGLSLKELSASWTYNWYTCLLMWLEQHMCSTVQVFLISRKTWAIWQSWNKYATELSQQFLALRQMPYSSIFKAEALQNASPNQALSDSSSLFIGSFVSALASWPLESKNLMASGFFCIFLWRYCNLFVHLACSTH